MHVTAHTCYFFVNKATTGKTCMLKSPALIDVVSKQKNKKEYMHTTCISHTTMLLDMQRRIE